LPAISGAEFFPLTALPYFSKERGTVNINLVSSSDKNRGIGPFEDVM